MLRIIAVAAAIAIATCATYAALKPAAAPEVRFVTLSGEALSVSALRGNVVLVNFWATWCAECMREMPGMVDTYRKYSAQGYRVLSVAVKSQREEVDRFALPFDVVLDDGGLARAFGNVRITPTSFLIDREGRIVARYVGMPAWPDFHAAIENAL